MSQKTLSSLIPAYPTISESLTAFVKPLLHRIDRYVEDARKLDGMSAVKMALRMVYANAAKHNS